MTEDRLRYLDDRNIINTKLAAIIEAFVSFYGEKYREEITQKFKDTLIIRFASTNTLEDNIRQIKDSVLREKYDIPEEEFLHFNIDGFVSFLNGKVKSDFLYENMDDNLKEKLFGNSFFTIEEIYRKFKNGEYPKLNEFLVKYEEINQILLPYQKLLDSEETKKAIIREKYYKKLVNEFKDLIPKEELIRYQEYGLYDCPVIKSYFDYGIVDNGHCFDKEHEAKLNNPKLGKYKRESIIRKRMEFLKANGYNYDSYDDALNDPKGRLFIEKSKLICEQIAKRKKKLYREQAIEMVNESCDYQNGRKSIDEHGYLDKDTVFGVYAYNNFGLSFCETNFILRAGKYVLSPIVFINDGTYDLDCTVIHELNHAFELMTIDVDETGYRVKTGWEIQAAKFSLEQKWEQIRYEGITRDCELINEYVCDRIGCEITDIMHEQGDYILNRVRKKRTSQYLAMDFLLDDFYREFKDIIIESRHTIDMDYLDNMLGKGNFKVLNELVNFTYQKFGFDNTLLALNDYNSGRNSADAVAIKEIIDKKNMIMDAMHKHIPSNYITSGNTK